MRSRLALLALAVLAAPGFAAAEAGGPAIRTALQCYLPGQEVRVTGSGFHAGDRYSVVFDRKLVGTGLVRAGGRISGRLSSGRVPGRIHQVSHRILLADGALQAATGFRTSAFGASFNPSAGDPRTLRVRYAVDALGLSAPAGAVVWLHYVDPRGAVRRSAAIGRTHGACGSLRSIRHRLFPLRPRPGSWQLQFDLDQTYAASSHPRIVLRVRVG